MKIKTCFLMRGFAYKVSKGSCLSILKEEL